MITVVHGGQTGVDRGAHEAALDNAWPVGGYMPRNGRDEDGPIPPAVARFLRPCARNGLAARTVDNVHDSDALLVIVQDADDPRATPGTAKTIELATDRRLRRMIADPGFPADQIARWIWRDLLMPVALPLPFAPQAFEQPSTVRLMIAGPRESKWPGARVEAAGLLRRVDLELRKLVGDTLQRLQQRAS